MVAAIFTAVYMFVPNTKVKWKPALIGGVTAGILWAAVGKLFTALVVYSTRLTVVYAGFAIIVAALLWTYFGWLILLIGAQLSFYVQNRNYLRMGLTELRMSAVQREQLTLKIMFLIGRSYHDGKTRWSVDSLAHELGMPGIAISRIVHALEGAHLLTLTDDEQLLPARDLGKISIQEIVDIARNEKAGQVGWRNLKTPGGGRDQQDDGRRLAQELRGDDAARPHRRSLIIGDIPSFSCNNRLRTRGKAARASDR